MKITYHLGAMKINTLLLNSPRNYEELKERIEFFFKENKLPPCEYRTYWIDADLDEIEILNHTDYNVFQTYSKSLHVSPVGIRENTTVVHNYIRCDSCKIEPIIGFRYKCIQCPDYDLCQACESLHFHPHHMMVRMPTKNCPIDEYIVRSHTECRCGSNATRIGNMEILIAAAATATAAKISALQPQETVLKAAQIAAKVAHATALKAVKNSTQIVNSIPSTSSSATADGGEKGEEEINKKVDSEPPPYTIPVEVLNNFNVMFTNIFDLMEKSETINNQNTPNLRKNSTTPTKSSETSNGTSLDSEVKSDDGKLMQKDQTPEKAKENQKTGDDFSLVVVENVGSGSENPNVSESFVEVHNPNEENIPASTSSKAPTAISSGQNTAPQPLVKSSVIDLVQLDTTFKIPVAKEAVKTSVQSNVTAAATDKNTNESVIFVSASAAATNTSAPKNSEEKRSVIVYHADQRINDAINAMISMGFRNEEAWLTHILESVNGNIPEALELISVSQRNDSR